MLLALCAGQYVAGLYTRPRYGRPLRQLFVRRRPVDEPYQCSLCGHWREEGHFSELDDEFVCDECAMGAASGLEFDCD
jgi:rubredoxin